MSAEPDPLPHRPGPRDAAIGVLGVGTWVLDRNASTFWWDATLRSLHGLHDHEATPTWKTWLHDWLDPADRARLERALAQEGAGAGRAPGLRVRVRCPSGALLRLLVAVQPDGGPSGRLQGLAIDITRWRSFDVELARAEDRVALIARAVGLGTWELDLATGEATWDAAMWALRNRPPRPEAPAEAERLSYVHPDDRERVGELGHAWADQTYEFRVVWPDKQVRWLASRSAAVHDEQGRPLRRIGINWDVTSRRLAEAALREHELALRESESRRQMLARVSHELRTPLHAVLGIAQLLRDTDPGPERRAARLAELETAGRQLLTMVDELLDLAGQPEATAPPAAALQPRGPSKRGRPTVLYVEDNAVNALIVSELLARRGDVDVVVAETGLSGLEQARASRPELVLLDMQLPDLTGLEVLRRLRDDPATAHVPCVALSANALQGDIDVALAAGLADYLTKPLDFAAFGRMLDRFLGPAPPR